MSKFWSPLVHGLTPYIPGEQPKNTQLIKLNTNENPYPPSDQVIEAIQSAAQDKLQLYPDPSSSVLRGVIAENFGLQLNQVFVGNGSDEVLAHVFQALFQHDQPLLFPEITYSFYPVYCGLYGIAFNKVPLADDFGINLKAYTQPNGGVIFPNPNAPTGMPLSLATIEAFLNVNTESVVVVDEAYVDFGANSAVQLIDQYPNLLVTQTVSKSRSLAGLRLGYALGHADLIEALVRVKDSFNSYPIDRLAEAGGIAAFKDKQAFEATCQAVTDSREKLVADMQALGFNVLPSAANFVFAEHPDKAGVDIAHALRTKKIIVRYFSRPEQIANFLRITIGTSAQMDALVTALAEIVQ